MQLQDNKKKWLKWVPAMVLAPLAVGVWLVPYFRSEPPTPGLPSAPTVSPARPALAQPKSAPPAVQSADVRPMPMPNVPIAGNLGTITDLRAQLQEKQIRLAIHDIDAKLGVDAPNVASRVAVLTPDDLARMVAPEKTPGPETAPAVSPRPIVVSVQGVDGKLSATLRSGGKLLTLRVGQKFSGGMVAFISRDEVKIRDAHGLESLAFE